MDHGDQLSLPDIRRDVYPDLPGTVTQHRHGQSREILADPHGGPDGDGLGAIEIVEETNTYNPWDDLEWLVGTRNTASFYPGENHRYLCRVLDEHIDRVLAGHAGCGCDCGFRPGGATPAMPEDPTGE